MRLSLLLAGTAIGLGASAARAEKIFYVAPTAQASGNGLTGSSAAEYRSASLWQAVQSALATDAVTVQFTDGTYSSDTLSLNSIGDAGHKLTLAGNSSGSGAVFSSSYPWNIRLRGSRNITFQNLHFTGPTHSFALHMQSQNGTPTRDIIVDHCSFVDMPKADYGAIGITFDTYNVTVQNSTFQRVGSGGGAHMIYTDHGPHDIYVRNNLFEDDPGDYVRFRDNVGHFEVTGNTFRSTTTALDLQHPFVSMPLFNDVNPGDEVFATDMVVRGNRFEYAAPLPPGTDPTHEWFGQAISFANFGFNYPGLTYQLTPEQAAALQTGDKAKRVALLKQLTGIDMGKVSISDNKFVNVAIPISYGSLPKYGSPSSGWKGFFDISDLLPTAPEPSGPATPPAGGPATPSLPRRK